MPVFTPFDGRLFEDLLLVKDLLIWVKDKQRKNSQVIAIGRSFCAGNM